MCGRFYFIATREELRRAFPTLTLPDVLPQRFNIAPTQLVPLLTNSGGKRLEFFRWGLVPSWAKSDDISSRLINARAETLAEKPSFRAAYRNRRCLIFASGFYEWRAQPGSRTKTPYAFALRSAGLLSFAGLWETWHSPQGEAVYSCTIITTTANALLQRFHDRMPVILAGEDAQRWLDPAETATETLSALLRPFPAERMQATPLSPLVNSPSNDTAECLLATGPVEFA